MPVGAIPTPQDLTQFKSALPGTATGTNLPANMVGVINQAVPGFAGLPSGAASYVNELMQGAPPLDRNAAAYYGVSAGVPGSDFANNRGYDMYQQQAGQRKQAGFNDFLSLLQGVSGTLVPTAGQALTAQSDAARLAQQASQFEQSQAQQGSQFGQTLAERQAEQAAAEAQFEQQFGLSQSEFGLQENQQQFQQGYQNEQLALQRQQQAASQSQFGQTLAQRQAESSQGYSEFLKQLANQQAQQAFQQQFEEQKLAQDKSLTQQQITASRYGQIPWWAASNPYGPGNAAASATFTPALPGDIRNGW